MRALVIEDYEPLRVAIVNALSGVGWAVDNTGNGDEGLWYARGMGYDAVILDLMLPGTNGMDVLRSMREAGNEAPVLVLTAKSEVESRVEGLDAGADDYLVKPFAMVELLARVRSIVRRSGPTRSPQARISDLTVDTVKRSVKRGSRVIELSPREYALLEYLLTRPGEVVTRREIWEHVYNFHADCQSNVVDVYVGYLRRKLEAAGESRLLHTRRGHGYVLGPEA